MKVAVGEIAVCKISQQKYYFRQWHGGKDPLHPRSFFPLRQLIIAVTLQLYT